MLGSVTMKVECRKCLNSGIRCKIYGTSLPVAIRFCKQDDFQEYITRSMILRKGENNETPKEGKKAESKSKSLIEK